MLDIIHGKMRCPTKAEMQFISPSHWEGIQYFRQKGDKMAASSIWHSQYWLHIYNSTSPNMIKYKLNYQNQNTSAGDINRQADNECVCKTVTEKKCMFIKGKINKQIYIIQCQNFSSMLTQMICLQIILFEGFNTIIALMDMAIKITSLHYNYK